MHLFKFLWTTHKWTGIVLAIVFLNLACSGFLLLYKKDYDWIQPETLRGAPGEVADFLSIQKLFAVVFAAGHADFQTLDDIDRVDFRPGRRIHKVRSVRNYTEMQIDAVSGAILSTKTRRSDWLEKLHDGSLIGDWAHGWLMPATALALAFLVLSGLYMWYFPIHRKRQRGKAERRRREVPSGAAAAADGAVADPARSAEAFHPTGAKKRS